MENSKEQPQETETSGMKPCRQCGKAMPHFANECP